MAWRFRKSVKLLPGVRLNFSKRGVSTTIGVRGASVNIGKRGTYVNTGIPGTGLYNRTKVSDSHPAYYAHSEPHTVQEAANPSPPIDHPHHARKYKHRLWPWWIFGTIGVALLQSPALIDAFWALLVLVWLVRPIVHHFEHAATGPETPVDRVPSPIDRAEAQHLAN